MELVVPGGLIIKNDGVSQLQYAAEEVQKVVEFRGVLLVVGYNNHNPKLDYGSISRYIADQSIKKTYHSLI